MKWFVFILFCLLSVRLNFSPAVRNLASVSEERSCYQLMGDFLSQDSFDIKLRMLYNRYSFSELYKPFSLIFRSHLPSHSQGEKHFIFKVLRSTQWFVSVVARIFSPVQIHANSIMDGPTAKIFEKLYSNPNGELSSQELELLNRYELLRDYIHLKVFYQKNPRLTKLSFGATITANSLKIISAGLAGVLLLEQVKEGPVTVEDFLTDEKYELKENQVQIINEVVPFPHTAIRVGDSVYSYGQTHMTVSPVTQYMQERKINALRELNSQEVTDNEDTPFLSKKYWGDLALKLYRSTG